MMKGSGISHKKKEGCAALSGEDPASQQEDDMKKLRMAIMGAGGIASCMARTIAEMENVERYAIGLQKSGEGGGFCFRIWLCKGLWLL